MSTIREDIANQTFQKVYLLYGEEAYERRVTASALVKAAKGDDTMNFMSHTGSEVSLSEVRDFTDTMPFFADRRVLLLEDSGLFKGASNGFDTWISELPDTAVVIFSESEIDKRNKLYKEVLNTGTIQEFGRPDADTLQKYVLRRIGKAGKNITKDAFERFMSMLPMDYSYANNELEKLLSYAYDEPAITEEMVIAIGTPSIEDHVFALVEAVADGRQALVMKYYYELIALREAPLKILALLGKEFERLSVINEMQTERASDADMVAALSLNPKILWKFKKQATRFRLGALKQAVKDITELENAVKSGDLTDRVALEIFIFKMTGKRS